MEHCSVVERDAAGNAVLVIGTHVDISAHKSIQIELLDSQRFLNLVLNTIPDMVYWKDTESRYLGANLAYAQVAGFEEPRDIVGLTDYELPWAEHTSKYQLADRRAIHSGKPIFSINQAFVDASGTQHVVETSKVPIVDDAGAALGVLGISQEVSKQRQYEKQLEKLAQCITGNDTDRLLDALTQAAVELSSAAIAFVATTDQEGKTATIVSTYPADAEITGLSYPVDGTPCERLFDNEFCIQAKDAQAAYPTDQTLVDMGVISYAGKRLSNNQNSPIGIFALLDIKPLADPTYAMSVLNIVAATASAELQREDREIDLRESELRYRTT
ncbi:MAG: PAS domain S-box-containing protein [Gammaproteobacteria bacterium]|jgi:PAS domain S-box-containing protein